MRLLDALIPPLCAICELPAGSREPLCPSCGDRLSRSPTTAFSVAGVELALALGEHEGLAGELVRALKFKRRLVLAQVAAERLAAAKPGPVGSLVPVPASPLRRRWRGFDSAAEIALALGRLTGTPVAAVLRRRDRGAQRGRPRSERLAHPPAVESAARPPCAATLIDDVVTTGATLSACASALRAGGCTRILALAVARA